MTQLMTRLTKIANFFRLLDENGLLSLTNVAVMLVLVKIAIAKTCDISSMTMLLTALSGYNLKRYMKTKESKRLPEDDINDIKSQLNSIKMKMGLNEGRLR